MNQNSKVLALKYRPQVFEDLIGQEVAAETIFNSIKSKKSANAYLFTGIRGIGKTTFARIVAKSLNCENGVDNLCKQNNNYGLHTIYFYIKQRCFTLCSRFSGNITVP